MSANQVTCREKDVEVGICLKTNRISPARRLMPELLEMIFRYSASENQSAVEALKLSHVSQSWRATALEISSLWSTISIGLSQDMLSNSTLQNYRSLLQHQLKFSRERPLDVDVLVYFDQILPRDSNAERDIRGLLQDLVSDSHRWRRANISILTCNRLSHRICLKHSPLLEELRMSLSSADHPWHCVHIGKDTCPKLARLELTGDFRVESAGQNPSLRHLSLRPLNSMSPFLTMTDYADILRRSPGLETVSLRCLGHTRTCIPSLSSTICMPSLRELRVEHETAGKATPNINPSTAANNAISLLSQLTLPSLEKLKISIQTKDVRVDAGRELRALIERSCPPLKWLVIEGSHVSNLDLILALRFLPNLTHLRLKGFSRYLELLLDELTLRETTSTPTCPNLQSIRVSDCIVHDWSVIARMILSRWNNCDLASSTESSHFEFKEYGPNAFLPQKILRCCTDGLCVEVHSQ
ncbi:hypothetical protein SCHPADRAFT_999237 [Schizopora paradoxa]|uniref:F-box domain-containing protein n=1 Tax=Schizopora paradoxa TaxID=27342 RepID=A0A0H2RHD1_9AGAM|nr:hypothetical protein SCHPADRAFT_999237 [Schizopora paradoxa]